MFALASLGTPLSSMWVSTTLQAESTRFLKNCIGLAQCANPTLLYIPIQDQRWYGSSIHYPVEETASLSSMSAHLFLGSSCEICSHKANWQAKFRLIVVVREALTVDPGMGRKKLSQLAKNMVAENDNNNNIFSTVMSSEWQT